MNWIATTVRAATVRLQHWPPQPGSPMAPITSGQGALPARLLARSRPHSDSGSRQVLAGTSIDFDPLSLLEILGDLDANSRLE